ncbi:DMT family transporter [Raoultibacter phocaeensis]|uniref:DMT family transporter n=1 Tax=Raoultibacter phocaeensis TaxID=2479841 RepID=UPI0011180D5C|nr:DMT family transporter [Raoultibacter phocaeensis]
MAVSSEVRGHAFALVTILIWGTTFVSTKVLLTEFQPVEILFYRFLIGFIALFALRPRHIKLTLKQEVLCAGAGLTGVTLYFLLENIALVHTTASNVGVIVAVAPFFTAIVSFFAARDERLRPGFFVGFAIAMAGILLMSSQGLAGGTLGDVLAVGAAAVWAVYSVITKKIGTFGYDSIQMTKRTFFWGLLFMLPALGASGFEFGFERFADPLMSANMAFLGLGASATCFVTWNLAIRTLGAVKTSAYIYLVPVITVAASVAILHEPLTALIACGVILTCAGLVISEWGKGSASAAARKGTGRESARQGTVGR